MIIAMMLTPLVMLLPSWRGPRWLLRRRRYLGVAAFCYGLTDGWVRKLGRRWKPLQQMLYVAAVATLLPWAALHNWGGIAPALVHFLPLGLLSAIRIYRNLSMRPNEVVST